MPRAVSRQDKPVDRSHARSRAGAAARRPKQRAGNGSIYLGRAFELAALLESTSDAVVGVSPDGLITGWGEGAQRLFGYPAAEVLGRQITILAPAERSLEAGGLIERVMSGARIERVETTRVTKEGRLLNVQLSVAPIWGEDQELAGAVGIYRDLSAQRNAEEALQAARFEDLRRLALMAEYRDDDTNKHTERVAHAAALLATELNLDRELVRTIRRAAPLHDVGKVGIPDEILLKPGKLTHEEFEVIKTHTVIGGRILSESRFPVVRMAMEIAFTHHEHWDGSGYPSRLQGDGIPISGRIVAVADAFDAMTHTRPYKAALPVEHAVAEIVRCRASQFDPRVVDAFIKLDHHTLVDAPCG
jgi:PAS domain S-box-containing protein/putative nucleotidyltransferase with HDIG domain